MAVPQFLLVRDFETSNDVHITRMSVMKQFSSGAKSSEEAPRYDLIEPAFVRVTAGRMAKGAETHGPKNYLSGVDDPEFIRDRVNHLVGHVLALAAGDTSDDHFAAVCANCNMLAVLLGR